MLVGMAWECFCATGTPGALEFRGVGREIEGAGTFESLLHRHILEEIPRVRRSAGFFLLSISQPTPVCAPVEWCLLGIAYSHTRISSKVAEKGLLPHLA
jgi:hypothetical protein